MFGRDPPFGFEYFECGRAALGLRARLEPGSGLFDLRLVVAGDQVGGEHLGHRPSLDIPAGAYFSWPLALPLPGGAGSGAGVTTGAGSGAGTAGGGTAAACFSWPLALPLPFELPEF